MDFGGNVLAQAGWGEAASVVAEIDLAALRRFRRRASMETLFARQRFELYAASYARASFYPPNTMAAGVLERGHFLEMQRQTIAKLAAAGLIPKE